MSNIINNKLEEHPFKPFISPHVKVMMIGSFPPAQSKWRMEFYYPNFHNDMWRIFGLALFQNKDFFLAKDKKSFDVELLKKTLIEKGIGIADMGKKIIRLKNNASDKYLQIVKPLDVSSLLHKMPLCHTFITAGEKATETLRLHFSQDIKHPAVGEFEKFQYDNREYKIYRLPSSSRAYPLPLIKKADIYKQCFQDIGIL